jgi:tRNA/rRNA methyltransferase
MPAAPVIVLCEPQLGENVGTAARAMANFGLGELRIVNPREGWPNAKATAAASGASLVIDNARVFATLAEAIGDLAFVYATTARARETPKPVGGPRAAVAHLRSLSEAGKPVGVIFGRERTGLSNEEVSLADEILTLPVDPQFSSLNIAQAVLIVAYEWRIGGTVPEEASLPFAGPADLPAPKEALMRLFTHLEAALEAVNFFRPAEKRPHFVQAIRTMLQKARLTEREIHTLRGAVAALERRPTRPRTLPDGSVTTERGKFD